MEVISEFDSLTTCSKRVVADLVESRSEKFQENEKKKVDLIRKVLKGTVISFVIFCLVLLNNDV